MNSTQLHDGADPGHAEAESLPCALATHAWRVHMASLRHDLRTPLNAVIGYGEILLEDVTTSGREEIVPHLQKIVAAGRQLLMLVNTALDPGRSETDRSDGSRSLDDATLCQELHTPLDALIGYVEVLLLEATDCGEEDIIPDLQKILVASHRFSAIIDSTFTTAEHESGKHDRSPEDVSAAVLIEDAVNTIPMSGNTGNVAGARYRGRILVVDDSATNRDILIRRLAPLGHTMTEAEDGRQALEIVAQQPFDLILLDVMMPEMNGYQVLQHLKTDDALRDIPVIIISAIDDLDSVVSCIELGANDYLAKPFNPVILRARIDAGLEYKRHRDQEVAYLHDVAVVVAAATAVEVGTFDAAMLDAVTTRNDELGQLARVFQRMARQVYSRELGLKQQVHALQIEVDMIKEARMVAEITETDYFRTVKEQARKRRSKT